MKKRFVSAIALALMTSMVFLAGCSKTTAVAESSSETSGVSSNENSSASAVSLATGGTLYLSVNPEIAIFYDGDGKVTKVEGRNDDGSKILADYTGYEGKEARQVVRELVAEIGEAGYFAEEIEGENRQITIEIEAGSSLPHDGFLEEVAADVRECVNSHHWHSPVDVEGESSYGMTEYHDTDYGPNNDGVTNYDDTDYGPNNDGVTNYDDTDYGPNNDGVTNYDDTDYGPNNDGVTNYDDTDYGPNNDGVTDYSSDDGDTDYDDTDYGDDDDDDDDDD